MKQLEELQKIFIFKKLNTTFSNFKKELYQWSEEEIAVYLKMTEHFLEPLSNKLSEFSLEGLGVNFHISTEMTLMEAQIKKLYGANSFRVALQKSQVGLLKIFINMQRNTLGKPTKVYMWAHSKAMLKEIEFYKMIAGQKGYDLKLLSILATVPRLHIDFANIFSVIDFKESTQLFKEKIIKLNLLDSFDDFIIPTLSEINQALSFWESVEIKK